MNPKTKVFVNGKQIKWRNQYGSMSKWQIFKWNMKNLFRKVLRWTTVTGITAGMVYIIFMAGGTLNPVMSYAVQEKVVNSDTLTGKIKELQAGVVTTVKDCERAGMTEDDGIIILDSNNKMSIGVLQFQKLTVIHYYKNIYGKDITAKEAVEIALDETKATQLASDIIFSTPKGLSNWLNCANKHNLAPKVAVIKELMK